MRYQPLGVRLLVALLSGMFLLASSSTQAAVISFGLSIEFSGGTPPAAAPPWLRATFDDGGGAGSVDLFLEEVNLTANNEFVFQWLFNLDPALDPTALVFSAPTKTGAFTTPTISTGVDAFMANGDGLFDINVRFDTADGPAKKFGAGDAALYTITGIPSLTANSFNFLSAMDGGQGSFPTAAQIGGIGPNDESGWISVPEPMTTSLLALGGLTLIRRRR